MDKYPGDLPAYLYEGMAVNLLHLFRGEAMAGNHFRCTGQWNDEDFYRVIEAEDEEDARAHWYFWASVAGATIMNLEIKQAA